MRIRSIVFAFALAAAAPLVSGCDVVESGEEQNASASAGKFETFEGVDGQFYFHLVAGNHERILASEGYATRSSAKKGVETVKKYAVEKARYEILEAQNGEFYFNLKAKNGEIIGTSETYDSKSGAEAGAARVRKLVAKQLRIEAAKTGGAKFTVFKGADGDTYFNMRAENGEIVLQSEGYEAKADALGGIESVRANGSSDSGYEIVELDGGRAYFRIVAPNGEIVGRSEIYASVSNAQRGMETVRDLLASERVADPK